MTRTAIIGILMLSGLVGLLYFRNGLIAAIGFAVAIILGHKEVRRMIATATNRRNLRPKDNSKAKHGT